MARLNELKPGSIGPKRQELNARRVALTDEIVKLESRGVFCSRADGAAPRELRARAMGLLNGSAAAFAERFSDDAPQIDAFYAERELIDAALNIAEKIEFAQEAEAAAQRFEEHRADYEKAMRGIVGALLALEHAQQARDRLIAKIRPLSPLPGSNLALAGRLGLAGSIAYRALQQCVANGWLSQSEFRKEIENARQR
jgi:hypothetical protein